MKRRAIIGARIFDGADMRDGAALLLDGEAFERIADAASIPADYEVSEVSGGTITPGFVDLQVNGGGGFMFNDDPSVATLRTIAKAHAGLGTRAFLPTLITDAPDVMRAGVDAVAGAVAADVPGIIGIHLEGPHLSIAKKGAHDPALIRSMDEADVAFLMDAAARLPNVMVTVAPENTTTDQIKCLSDAGIIVSLGHTDCSYDQAQAAFAAGARCVTHLFNAMSQLGSREPGLVGAALTTNGISAGLIADDVHVHASSMRVALAAKQKTDGIFLVTDAMPPAGSLITEFALNGRTVSRREGRLTLEDGTLAGADLDLPRAISLLVAKLGLSAEHALRMATSAPARCLAAPGIVGRFVTGQPANAIHLDDAFTYQGAV